jgi:RNA polymerase sigma factor (TIGR02999 family)
MNTDTSGSSDEISFDEMYATLRRIAQSAMRGERPSHTLQPTALVHEYLLSMPNGFTASAAENVQIVRIAGWRMRRLLIDYARKRLRHHLGSDSKNRVELEAVDADGIEVRFPDLELLDNLLPELQKHAPEAAAVVEMRFFCGLTHKEIAKALSISIPTVERRWREAKEWVKKKVSEGDSAVKS